MLLKIGHIFTYHNNCLSLQTNNNNKKPNINIKE